MSSKAKQILLWLMIISSALLFVWFIQRTQSKPPQDLSFDKALTIIRNKEASEAVIKQDSLEITDKSGAKSVTKLDASDASRDLVLKAADETRHES